jgi:hypothetical protein
VTFLFYMILSFVVSISRFLYYNIYIYIYVCVCVCVCVREKIVIRKLLMSLSLFHDNIP